MTRTLIIAPMLTTAIPADIWSARPCFIVHPGPRGDRGPSSLDWAIMGGARRWGVTVLQANAEMDAGDIWASAKFTMPGCSKSSVYRTEVADAARSGGAAGGRPGSLAAGTGPSRWITAAPTCAGTVPSAAAGRPTAGSTGWPSPPRAVLAKLRAADSSPGVLDVIGDTEYYLFGGHTGR